jgi:hypothetical protein
LRTEIMWLEDREVLLEMFLRSSEDPVAILWWKGMEGSRGAGEGRQDI